MSNEEIDQIIANCGGVPRRHSHAPVDSRDARIEALKIALRECADDLESEIKERYGASIHPAMQRKYDKDMAPVIAAHKLLKDEK